MSATSRRRGTLWVVSELYHPERTSTGRFLTGIAEGLADDIDVRAVCAQPTYAARGVTAPWRERLNGVDVIRCPSTRFDKDSLVGRVFNVLTVSGALTLRVLTGLRRGDCVLVVTNPPLLPYLVALAARLRGARSILLVHDVYPDVLVGAGLLAPDSRLRTVGEAVSRWLYRSFDRVVVLGRDMEALIAGRLGRRADRIHVIPNWGDVERIRPVPTDENPVRSELGIEDAFVVGYLGNLGRTHGIEDLVEVARSLDDRGIAFLFVGRGAMLPWVTEQVEGDGMAHARVVPGCSEEELTEHLTAADVSIIPLRPGMSGVSVPSRLYNVLAAGRPVVAVAERDSELARVVDEEGAGWVVPPGERIALCELLLRLRDAPREVAERGRRAREAAVARYSARPVMDAYRALLDDLEDGR